MLYNLFKAELFKSLRFKMLWFATIIPAFFPALTIFSLLDSDAETFRLNMAREHETSAFYYISVITMLSFSFMISLTTGTVIISLNYIEKQANGWKYLVMSPFTNSQVMLVKVFISILFVFSGGILFYLFHMLFGKVFSLLRPDLGVQVTGEEMVYFLLMYLRMMLAALGIFSALWAVALASRSYIIVIFFLSLFGMLVPGKVLPFNLPAQALTAMSRGRRDFNFHNKHFGSLNLLEPGISDALSIAWFVVGFILIVLFFKRLTKKLI